MLTSPAFGWRRGRARDVCRSLRITSSTCRSRWIGSSRERRPGSTCCVDVTGPGRRAGWPMTPASRLAGLVGEGRFVVTAELSSSNSADPEATWRRAEVLRGSVDAINCTDNTGAHVHMSSLAAAHLLVEKG